MSPNTTPHESLHTGVIQPLPGIGDMIWYLPALKAIAAAAPDSKITLFTKASAQASTVLGGEPMISDIVTLPSKRRGAAAVIPNFFRTWLALFRARPDRLFILHQSFRYRLAARLAGIREIIAYPPVLARSKEDGWKKSLSFLKQLGVPIAEPHSHLAVNPATVAAMRQRFLNYPQPWLIIAPGASTATRLWPTERFAFCADALIDKTGGTVFLIGSQQESERIAAVQRSCRNADKTVLLSGLPFDQVMGLIACSACLLGNDSGPANVAAALGCLAFPLCGTSTPPQHSPNLHFIMPDLASEMGGGGMERISAQHALDVIRSVMNADNGRDLG